jgi:hypothetical protein
VTWRRDPAVLWRRTPAHVVAARPPATEPTILSGTGRDLWDRLAVPAELATLQEVVGTDPGPVLEALSASGLVRQDDSPAPLAAPEVDAAEAAAREPMRPTARAGPGDLLAEVLTFWLPGGPDPILTYPVDGEAWTALMDRARRERCIGPLCWAVGTGALAATDDQREESERYAILGARHAIEQEAELLEVAGWLEAAGIEMRVLKGLAVAHLDHLDPSFRASADHDLLVRSEAIDDAVALLAAQGYARDLPERRRGHDRRFAKDVTLQLRDRFEIDLHRLPLAGPLGLALDLDALWEGSALFVLGGRSLPALDSTGRFCHAAWSLALTDPEPRLVPALDLVAINQRHGVDPERLDAIAPTGAGRAAVDAAIELSASLLGPSVEALLPSPHAGQPSRWERRAMATYPGQGGSKAGQLLAATQALPTSRDRLAYLAALALPANAYRRARHQAHRDPEWRIALRSAARRLRPPNP